MVPDIAGFVLWWVSPLAGANVVAHSLVHGVESADAVVLLPWDVHHRDEIDDVFRQCQGC